MVNEKYMKRALTLAARGLGSVSTNPMVGAVVVANDTIIGEGYHRLYGEAHAEVNAIASIKESDRKLLPTSTIYVTLEPCCHYGKTPPCTELIIRSGIKRVVIAMRDPFAEVSGRGVYQLQNNGVEVIEGILEDEARVLNRRFITYHTEKRPYVILKWAESADGYIDSDRAHNEPPIWLTGFTAKMLVHRWRAEEDAIMVGANTVLRDNPSLTVREWQGKNPIRVTYDSRDTLSVESKIFNNEAESICYKHRRINEILSDLHSRGVQSIIVEGGTKLLQSFIDGKYYDEIRRFVAPTLISAHGNGGGTIAPTIKHTNKHYQENIGNVILHNYSI